MSAVRLRNGFYPHQAFRRRMSWTDRFGWRERLTTGLLIATPIALLVGALWLIGLARRLGG